MAQRRRSRKRPSDPIEAGYDVLTTALDKLFNPCSMTTAEYRKLHNIPPGVHVHHQVAYSLGGRDCPKNYMALPAAENIRIGNSVLESFRLDPKNYLKELGMSALFPQKGVKVGGPLKLVAAKLEEEKRVEIALIVAVIGILAFAAYSMREQR